jgi:hypothetical protein
MSVGETAADLVVWCNSCNKWEQLEVTKKIEGAKVTKGTKVIKGAKVPKEASQSGWKKIKGVGWVCPTCQGTKKGGLW